MKNIDDRYFFCWNNQTDVPSPETYQMDLNVIPITKRAFRPFEAASERFQEKAPITNVPGWVIMNQFNLISENTHKLNTSTIPSLGQEHMNMTLDKIVKFICYIVLVVEQNWFLLSKQNAWSITQIK